MATTCRVPWRGRSVSWSRAGSGRHGCLGLVTGSDCSGEQTSTPPWRSASPARAPARVPGGHPQGWGVRGGASQGHQVLGDATAGTAHGLEPELLGPLVFALLAQLSLSARGTPLATCTSLPGIGELAEGAACPRVYRRKESGDPDWSCARRPSGRSSDQIAPSSSPTLCLDVPWRGPPSVVGHAPSRGSHQRGMTPAS
jgi:hypothetical protein